jgi:hypothetical protein
MVHTATASATRSPITAMDIVLEPDATMVQHAKATNAGLLKNFPNGFALGDEHKLNSLSTKRN